MYRLQLGQPKVGKTKAIEEIINSETKKKVIFDFNNNNQNFKNVDGKVVFLEDYHPLVDALSLEEVKVLNAAYLKTSRCLFNKAKELFHEYRVDSQLNIVQDAVERLYGSWEEYEVDYARELSSRELLKVRSKQKSINEIVDTILNNEITIIKSKSSIHSKQLRAMMYMVMYKISKMKELEALIVADEVSTLFFNGNIKMLFEVIDINSLDIIMSCNRPSNIPKVLKEYVTEWRLFKNTNKSEVNWMKTEFKVGIGVQVEDMKLGEYIVHRTNQEGRTTACKQKHCQQVT